MKDRDILIWLNNIEGMSNRNVDKLLISFKELTELWNCSDKKIDKLNLNIKLKERIKLNRNRDFFNNIIENINRNRVDILTILDEDYPESLSNIPDSPKVLYIKGSLKNIVKNSISIIGTRKPSPYGIVSADKIATELSELGITIVSGMASGIDTQAHISSLKNNNPTIAVLGTGVDVIYPAHNKNIYYEIPENGALVSEFPLNTKGMPYNFPQRNRIISGLSLGTVVVEAERRSGSLITVNHALEQGKEVFSVPGNINSKNSEGTNKLIKDGAKLTECSDDIIDEIIELKNIKKKTIELSKKGKSQKLFLKEKLIIEKLLDGPLNTDQLIEYTKLGSKDLITTLLSMELKNLIKRSSEGTYHIYNYER